MLLPKPRTAMLSSKTILGLKNEHLLSWRAGGRPLYAWPSRLLTKALGWGRQAGLLRFFCVEITAVILKPEETSPLFTWSIWYFIKRWLTSRTDWFFCNLSVLFSRLNTVWVWTALDMFFRRNKAQNRTEVTAVTLCILDFCWKGFVFFFFELYCFQSSWCRWLCLDELAGEKNQTSYRNDLTAQY